jgi:topoisomerase IA-like protein
MENKTSSLGKINKKHVYLNHGQYGYYLTHDKVNYKIPDWFPHEKMDVDIAERLIEFKKKTSQQWLETQKQAKKEKEPEEENDLEDTETEADNINTFLNKNKKKGKKQESDDELSDEEIKKYVKLKRKGVI